MIGDTLWSRLDDREKRRLARVIIARLNKQAASFGEKNERLRGQVAPLVEAVSAKEEDARVAKEDALMWQMKARGRGGRGLLFGIPLGGLATYGGLKLFRVIP